MGKVTARGGGRGKRCHTDLGQSLTGDVLWVGGKMLNAKRQGETRAGLPRRTPGAAGYRWD